MHGTTFPPQSPLSRTGEQVELAIHLGYACGSENARPGRICSHGKHAVEGSLPGYTGTTRGCPIASMCTTTGVGPVLTLVARIMAFRSHVPSTPFHGDGDDHIDPDRCDLSCPRIAGMRSRSSLGATATALVVVLPTPSGRRAHPRVGRRSVLQRREVPQCLSAPVRASQRPHGRQRVRRHRRPPAVARPLYAPSVCLLSIPTPEVRRDP